MDFIIYLFLVVIEIGFGLLVFLDRLFPIIAALIGFIAGFYIETDQTIITNRVYDSTNAVWISFTIPTSQVQLLVIFLGLLVVINCLLLIKASA